MNPAFNLKVLQSFVPIFNEKIHILLENMENEVQNTYFDILPYMTECTLNMVTGKFLYPSQLDISKRQVTTDLTKTSV